MTSATATAATTCFSAARLFAFSTSARTATASAATAHSLFQLFFAGIAYFDHFTYKVQCLTGQWVIEVKNNNIVFGHRANGIILGQDGGMVFLDPNAPADQRFCMVCRFGEGTFGPLVTPVAGPGEAD